jgi:hypothetical protein
MTSTRCPPQREHTMIGTVIVSVSSQSAHRMRAGTLSTRRLDPASSVPSQTNDQQ